MASSRNRTEIISQILETVYDHDVDGGEGITRTKIMYAVYLSSGSLKEYLIALTVHRLLIFDSAMRRYHITEKVYGFLNYIVC
jgi:predicted transcriptional regulator